MNRKLYLSALTICCILLSSVCRGEDRLAISGKSGTLGFGGEITLKVNSKVNTRFGGNIMGFSLDGELADIDYDLDIDLLSFPLLVDWYPFAKSFHLTGGIFFNESEIGLGATPPNPLRVGGTTYTPAEIGMLTGQLTFEDVVPYVGIGWGNAFGKKKRWGFVSDAGVAFIGSPNVRLSGNGTRALDPGFQTDLAIEAAQIEDDIKDFKFFPVFSFSIFYRF